MLFSFIGVPWFHTDQLSWIMATLIVFVVANILAFSRRYLAGDRFRGRHLRDVTILGVTILIMAFANHLLLFLAAWGASNFILVRLMIHKPQWPAARSAGTLALKTFGLGLFFLALGFWFVAQGAASPSIQQINSAPSETTSPQTTVGLLLIALAAMTQSAAWPFHRWLMSSLNSPTPVSALMHAGLVNGGGFLLTRFAPLYLHQPFLLHGIFIVGLITAVVGTSWKLIQPDIKRMLACSTMGQMGFMIMQCGMGLFAPAVSHLCWHGLFKAYLFLNVGSVVHEHRSNAHHHGSSTKALMLAGFAGFVGAGAFASVSGLGVNFEDTSCLMIVLAFIAGAQLSVGVSRLQPLAWQLASTPLLAALAGSLYGFSVRLIDTILAPLHVMKPQPIDGIYGLGVIFICLLWMLFNAKSAARLRSTEAWKTLYVSSLNGSQPHPATVTANRTSYRF
ncbi:proton-conducting membrane transporter [bacterium]|nr:proton-conducting membrane transporter [bacterium]